jgi:hypothetical protein
MPSINASDAQDAILSIDPRRGKGMWKIVEHRRRIIECDASISANDFAYRIEIFW